MRKKHRNLQRKENVIVFPGTFDRLLTEGLSLVENYRYAESLDYLKEALSYEPEHPNVLGAYAFALYETRNYIEAKKMCQRLLELGPSHYLDAMELYMTICIQLKEYDEVEETISILIEEGAIPPDRMEQFSHLRDLNERIVQTELEEDRGYSPIDIEEFVKLPEFEQQNRLVALEHTNVAAVADQLIQLLEDGQIAPITKTFALLLLVKMDYDQLITIRKFGYESEINPTWLPQPDQTPDLVQTMQIVKEKLFQDPSREEMVIQVLLRHGFATYPFEWPQFTSKEVAEAYMNYVDGLLSGHEYPESPIHDFILKIEFMYQIRDV